MGVPEMAFLMIGGQGDPNTSVRYGEAVESLFAVSYGIKFASRKSLGRLFRRPAGRTLVGG